jgi:hypothetical protein
MTTISHFSSFAEQTATSTTSYLLRPTMITSHCKFCLRLRPARAIVSSMLKGKTGPNGQYRERRFCADCGFDTKALRTSQRYSPGTRVSIGQVDWVWCNHCRLVKRGERTSPCAKSVYYGMCAACYDTTGCRCGPVRGTCGNWLCDRC